MGVPLSGELAGDSRGFAHNDSAGQVRTASVPIESHFHGNDSENGQDSVRHRARATAGRPFRG